MKKKNWFFLSTLAIIVSLGMSSCYYGAYGPPRPHHHHHHHGHGGGYGYGSR